MVMDKIIFESCNGELIVIDGKGYPRKVVNNWTSEDFMRIRDAMLLKHQRESEARANSIYDAFGPYIVNAKAKEAQIDAQRGLARTIRQMPEEDVIAVFTIYFDEILNKKNGDDSKNE
jgi:hypothetical protein